MAVRSRTKGEAALAEIRRELPAAKLTITAVRSLVTQKRCGDG